MSSEGGGEKQPAEGVPDTVLRAALLRRAVESLQRLIQVRMAKQAITGLLARGSVGDDLFQRLQRAEQEIDFELRDVVSEVGGLVVDFYGGELTMCRPTRTCLDGAPLSLRLPTR